MTVKERAGMFIAGGALLLSILAIHVNTQTDIARVVERVDNMNNNHVQTLEAINKLTNSVDRLSHSVTRLDERTRVLERDRE